MPTDRHWHRRSHRRQRVQVHGCVHCRRSAPALQGNLSESIPTFETKSATLTYSSVDDLSGTRVFQGIIDATTISFGFGNGPSISGDLSASVGAAFSVNGSGDWESN
ncbi:hypothetical protein CERSUDRAFT_74240 [Gelatoporia subvermispora B]|uniref:Uncharacterized protein n=1 Tax=Ceriporiopsis subvermispora (strain B) TaxID=914234 RepID=M2RCQ9_CERS8|nr:hypothetical protein CERSUDRAFT_74240 [Gelatoporia subvermispora B]